jgi:hypothetical protein
MADDKKIIIDEDWKAQVQAEKDAAKSKAATDATEGSPRTTGPSGTAASSEQQRGPMPAASFELLVTMLATEAMVALGQVPHPLTGQMQVDRGQAQYLIDLVDMLREKTMGNLDTREQQVLEALLHELRMAFVQTAGSAPSGPPPDHLASV